MAVVTVVVAVALAVADIRLSFQQYTGDFLIPVFSWMPCRFFVSFVYLVLAIFC